MYKIHSKELTYYVIRKSKSTSDDQVHFSECFKILLISNQCLGLLLMKDDGLSKVHTQTYSCRKIGLGHYNFWHAILKTRISAAILRYFLGLVQPRLQLFSHEFFQDESCLHMRLTTAVHKKYISKYKQLKLCRIYTYFQIQQKVESHAPVFT